MSSSRKMLASVRTRLQAQLGYGSGFWCIDKNSPQRFFKSLFGWRIRRALVEKEKGKPFPVGDPGQVWAKGERAGRAACPRSLA